MDELTKKDIEKMKRIKKSFNTMAQHINCYTEMKAMCVVINRPINKALEDAIKLWLKQIKSS